MSTSWSKLSETEKEIVALVSEGLTNPQIADRLGVSPRTVQTHLYNIFKKTGVATRTELAIAFERRMKQETDESPA